MVKSDYHLIDVILNCQTFRLKKVAVFLIDKMIEQAKLLILCGNISPNNENKTGPTPRP